MEYLTTTTGQWAFSDTTTAVDPSTCRAIHPIPTDPTHSIDADCDSAMSASSTGPHKISASTLTVLPVAATADDAARSEVSPYSISRSGTS